MANSRKKSMWMSMVNLDKTVQHAIAVNTSQSGTALALDAAHALDVALQRYRSNFTALLRHPVKNAADRTILQRSMTEAMQIQGYHTPTKLPEATVRDALIISDMFNLNEISALSLLRAAEEESVYYPGMPRGLVAVLFYYDGREHLVHALKTLVQARQGCTWDLLPESPELSQSITQYLDLVLNVSTLDRVLELIFAMDLSREVELLQQNRALGDKAHRKLVLDKFVSVRNLLAEIVFCWAAQTPMKKSECLHVLEYLSRVSPGETSDGTLDTANLYMLMALLYSIESGLVLNTEDVADAVGKFPITSETGFLGAVHAEIRSLKEWGTPGLKAMVQLAWAVSLANLRQVFVATQLPELEEINEDREVLQDALKGRVFLYINSAILSRNKGVPLDQFHCQRLHALFTDLIVLMPEQVKAMKIRADENSRLVSSNMREGLNPPVITDQPFEELLVCLSSLYGNGQCGDAVKEYFGYGSYSSPPANRVVTASGESGNRQIALFKFVRLPGDFVPPLLFVPYVGFLASLATTAKSASQVYDFLRTNSQQMSLGGNLAWDHFFQALAQYHHNLRLEEQSPVDTMYRSNVGGRGSRNISTQELHGLVAVLKLMSQVVKHSELARVASCEGLTASPLQLCVGLLTCPVSLSLKAELVKLLAAFSLSPSLAQRVWEAIEAGGLLPPQDGVTVYQPKGLLLDMEEVESRQEEFPLTRSVLGLLRNLVHSGIPPMLGGSTRPPGFKPYLEAIRDRIFLPHDARSYGDAGERWVVAHACLEIIHELLVSPTHSDSSVFQPGRAILLDLLQDSPLLRQVYSVLHTGVHSMEQHTEIAGKKYMCNCILLVLQILVAAHQQQQAVLSSSLGTDVLLNIDHSLLNVNPHTGKSDHLLNIIRIVGHHQELGEHAALACHLLTLATASPQCQSHLLALITGSSAIAMSVQHSFVQLIDQATMPDHSNTAEAALKLILCYLPLPAVNVAHFLLGFTTDLNRLRTEIYDPGTRGYARSALHAMLSALPLCSVRIKETIYRILYIICSSSQLSAPTLRYLRSSCDLLYQGMASMVNIQNAMDEDCHLQLLTNGWIFRCVAIELRYHSSQQQRSQLARLLNLLVVGSDSEAIDSSLAWGEVDLGLRGPLLNLLDLVDLTIEPLSPLRCEYFFTNMESLIASCDEKMADGVRVNIVALHQKLVSIVQESGISSSNREHPLREEMQTILNYAVQMNQTRSLAAAHKHFLDGWRQVVEMVLAVTPSDMISSPVYYTFLDTLTRDVARRLADESSMLELATKLVSTLLMLVTTLRTLHVQPSSQGGTGSQFVSVLDSTNSGPIAGPIRVPFSLALVFKGIITCVTKFRHSSQSARTSIYAAMLNYLHIRAGNSFEQMENNPLSSLMQHPQMTEEEKFHRTNYDQLQDGELPQLVDLLAIEGEGGTPACRVLALQCLDALAALERRAVPLAGNLQILNLLCEQGHMHRLIDALQVDDQKLMPLLTSDEDLRPLYVYEARMSLFTRLALTPDGAKQLLLSGLTVRLIEMNALNFRPNMHLHNLGATEDFLPNLNQRYGTVLNYALRVYMAILTSLGKANVSSTGQVLRFLSSHADAVSKTLHGTTQPTVHTLEELSLLCGTLAIVSPPSIYAEMDPTELGAETRAARLQQLLITVLPGVLPVGQVMKAVNQFPENEDGVNVQEMSKTFCLGTLAAILSYCVDQMFTCGYSLRDTTLLFVPSTMMTSSSDSSHHIHLGLLIECIRQCTQHFAHTRKAGELTFHRLKGLHANQPVDNLRQLVGGGTMADNTSPSALRQLAEASLRRAMDLLVKQEELVAYAAEAATLLLWRHLEYFLLNAQQSIPKSVWGSNVAPRSLNHSQINILREEVRGPLNEIIPELERLNDTYSAKIGHVAFLAAVMTRLKRLIN